ncbi:MAG: hypothetical protein OXH63_02555 [Gemmatimonadetes bacterium]|nr:hypothetical protein [Gemmatimonadota bacterium]
MSESKVIPLPDDEDEAAHEGLSLDKLSDAQLAALSNETIQRLELDQRKQLACRYLVANEQRARNDPEYTTLGWIADRVGVDVRVLYRWRTEDSSWNALMEAERERAESYIGDLPLSSRRGRAKALQEMFDDPKTPGSVRLKISEKFERFEGDGAAAVKKEAEGARERMREKILQVTSRLSSGPPRSPTRRHPSPSEPTTDEPS